MTPPLAAPEVVGRDELRIGAVMAEGGEGRVRLLPRQPHLVFKEYRRPGDRAHLEELVAWPERAGSAEAATVVRAASAWPTGVVADASGAAVGLLVPRAPRRFALRHRDGRSRLASLSYLTSDPGHREVAYGLQLPAPVTAERIGLVYALARLLAAFETGTPSIGHGDLSTKNVLWSLQRGPEVFVIDCDSAELFTAHGRPLVPDGRPLVPATQPAASGARRRAMTPNWDDPAVPKGQNPSATTDRYSLGLIFLRVVGAANFPVQARQRAAATVEVRFPVPPGPVADVLLDPAAPVWDLCARSLSLTGGAVRPAAAEWLVVLEELLTALDARDAVEAVHVAQGGASRIPAPAAPPAPPASAGPPAPLEPPPGDVRITPVAAPRPARTWDRVSPAPRYGRAEPPGSAAPAAPAIGYRRSGAPTPGPPGPGTIPATATAAPQLWPELRVQLLRFWAWWRGVHRTRRLRGLVLCLVVDFAMLVAVGAVLALIISPIAQG